MRRPVDYFSLVEAYASTVAQLSRLSAADAEQASKEILELSLRLLERESGDTERLEKMAVWHADKFYRLVNQVDALDGSSFLFMRSVGAAFEAVTKGRGLRVAYLVDNEVPMDRMQGIRAAFSSLGFVVASPELFVEPLVAETPGARPEQVFGEAAAVAARQFRLAIGERRNVLWVSGGLSSSDLQALADMLRGEPYVGVFRNDAPADGTQVKVFLAGGRSERLLPA
ncbi:MAG TPA: hypothetical protein VMI75_33865 [Polyangiaceae bacterium]|nr:hypothetical protein [Polyangiaceae bacterium]